MARYVQNGDKIYYKNLGEASILTGDVVALGTGRAGVAEARILPGELGSVSLIGAYEFPADSTAELALGTEAAWDEVSSTAKAAVEGLPRLGLVIQKKETAGKTVLVRLE